MMNNPKCPYCGRTMARRLHNGLWSYKCPECGASSTECETREAAYAAAMKRGNEWVSVEDRLPEPRFAREWYLVALESGCVKSLSFERNREAWAETGSPVTHWQTLPKPPKEEEHE